MSFIIVGLGLIAIGLVMVAAGAILKRRSRAPGQVRKLVGMRKTGSQPGTWQDCFVAGIDFDDNIIAAYFQNNKDYIGHPTWPEIESTLEELADQGYKPMTKDDIRLTAGSFT